MGLVVRAGRHLHPLLGRAGEHGGGPGDPRGRPRTTRSTRCRKKLIDLANERGGDDNITVIVVQVQAEAAAPRPAETGEHASVWTLTPGCENHLLLRPGWGRFACLDTVETGTVAARLRTDGGQACWNTACLGPWTAWKRAVTRSEPAVGEEVLHADRRSGPRRSGQALPAPEELPAARWRSAAASRGGAAARGRRSTTSPRGAGRRRRTASSATRTSRCGPS